MEQLVKAISFSIKDKSQGYLKPRVILLVVPQTLKHLPSKLPQGSILRIPDQKDLNQREFQQACSTLLRHLPLELLIVV